MSEILWPNDPALRLPQIQRRVDDVIAYRQTLTGDETDEQERANPAYWAELRFDALALDDLRYLLNYVRAARLMNPPFAVPTEER